MYLISYRKCNGKKKSNSMKQGLLKFTCSIKTLINTAFVIVGKIIKIMFGSLRNIDSKMQLNI